MYHVLSRRLFLATAAAACAGPALGQTQPQTGEQPPPVDGSGQVPAVELPGEPVAEPAPPPLRIALVVPRSNDDYFNAVRQGALEAVAEVDGIQLSFLAPAGEAPALQAALVEQVTAERHDAIVISPVASDLVIAACARAVEAGIKVIAIGLPLPPDGRSLQLVTPGIENAAPELLAIVSGALAGKGEVAVLSTDPNDASHVAFNKALQKEWLKPEHAELLRVTTVFGADKLQSNYSEALAIIQAYPDLKAVIATSFEGLHGAAKAVMDLGRANAIKVTGFGLPSRLVAAVQAGVVPSFVTWSPVDVGYGAARIAVSLITKELTVEPGAPIRAGRLGELQVDESNVAQIGEFLTVDQSSIDKYSELF